MADQREPGWRPPAAGSADGPSTGASDADPAIFRPGPTDLFGEQAGAHDLTGSEVASVPDPQGVTTLGRARPSSTARRSVAGDLWHGFLALLKEVLIVVAMAAVLSFVIKTWLVQAFWIPSGSMENTLQPDDRVIVSKLTPGPFALHRGDIVVFEDPGAPTNPWITEPPHAPRSGVTAVVHDVLTFVGLLPDDSQNHLIKRVIGLPGDHITSDGKGPIKVNGVAINEPYVKPGDPPSSLPFDITVPAGRVWVMGDNRSDSSDSRYHPIGGDGSQGSVPIADITGRAVLIVWPASRWSVLSEPSAVFAKVPNPSPSVG